MLGAENDVNLAIVQGGALPKASADAKRFQTLACLYLEPIWVFYRSEQPLTELRQLKGLRIVVGQDGSGTQTLATQRHSQLA